MNAFIKSNLSLIKKTLNISLCIIFITFSSSLFIYFTINHNLISHDNSLRQLSIANTQIDDSQSKNLKFKWTILSHLISKTYLGTWVIQSNKTYDNFTEKKGVIKIIFNFLRKTKIQGTFYYDYYIVLFDGDDNQQSIIISNSYFFTLNIDNPIVEYDNETNVIFITDELQSSISQYHYLAPISQNSIETNTTMRYNSNQTGLNYNKELNGTITIKDIQIAFNTMENHPSFYQSISSFGCWLSVIGMIQAFYFKYQLKEFSDYPDEAFKYSPYTFVINCLYNGSIGFECFLASMINERLFYIFIIPSMIYFINFSLIELKVILLSMNIHERYDSRHSPLLMSIKARLIHFCILFYFLLICLFLYSFDIFFWKSVSLVIVIMTFIPQMIYGIKKNQNASIVYLVLISLNKLYIPIYFRTENNFFFFKKDSIFIVSVIIVLFLEVVIILFQRILWRTSYMRSRQERAKNKKQNKNTKLYKTIKELQMKNIDINNIKCSICLGDLNASNQLNTNPSTSLVVIEEEKKNDNSIEEKKRKEIVMKENCCKRAFKCFKLKGNKEKEIMVMMTPCKHIFHIECLEEWLKIKYTCPQCRCVLPQIN